MTDKIKSQLTTAYMMFIFEFHDPLGVDKDALETKMPCKVDEIFSSQRNCDRSKRKLQDDFPKALCLYFKKYQTIDGVDVIALQVELDTHGKTMKRHLGKDKMVHLRLIINLMRTLNEKPIIKGGLLSERAA